jgi:hypothetical protein
MQVAGPQNLASLDRRNHRMYLLTIRSHTMKKLVVLLLASLIASSAFAVMDPDPNGIGIYFDLTADDNCKMVGASMPFNAYLILTNTDAPTVSAYEVGYLNVVPAGMESLLFRLSSLIANGVVSGLDLGNSSNILDGDHIVGLAAPLVSGPATVLHAWQYMLLSPTVTMEMFISSASQSSIEGIYPVILNAETSTLFQAYHSTGIAGDMPVATVNLEPCVVGVENASFGSVKSLFR